MSPRTNLKLLFPGHFAIAFCFFLRTGESATSLRAVITGVAYCELQPDGWVPAEAGHKRVTDFWGLSNRAVLSESMTMPVRYLEQTTKYSSKELARFAKKERLCTSETYCHSKPSASVSQQISGSLARKSWCVCE